MPVHPLSVPLSHLNEACYIFPLVVSPLTDVTTDAAHGGHHTFTLQCDSAYECLSSLHSLHSSYRRMFMSIYYFIMQPSGSERDS